MAFMRGMGSEGEGIEEVRSQGEDHQTTKNVKTFTTKQ
jgi:hypothetical protein